MVLSNGLKLLIGIILLPILSMSRISLENNTSKEYHVDVNSAPIFLPKKEAVKAITLGYENLFANIYWFSTINYFGEKFLSKESMPWFKHRCDLVTDLDPKAKHVFEFCGTLLSWIAKDPKGSSEILSKGILANPEFWRYYYLRGFNNWYFLNDLNQARKDFEKASTLPDAPSFLVSLASRLMVKEGEEETAIAFLKSSYVRTSDFNAKQAIAEKLNLAVVARDIRKLNLELESNGKNKLEALKDPFGDDYQYDTEKKTYYSIKGGLGLSFKGKNSETSNLSDKLND